MTIFFPYSICNWPGAAPVSPTALSLQHTLGWEAREDKADDGKESAGGQKWIDPASNVLFITELRAASLSCQGKATPIPHSSTPRQDHVCCFWNLPGGFGMPRDAIWST